MCASCCGVLQVLLSSIAVYGELGGPWSESSPTAPSSPFGISKLAAELHVLSAATNFGMSATVLRAHGVCVLDRPP